MSTRRKPGDWIRPKPDAGMCGDSSRLLAQIQPETDPMHCFRDCGDRACREWATLWTEPDPESGNKRHVLCHVSECEMDDAEAGK